MTGRLHQFAIIAVFVFIPLFTVLLGLFFPSTVPKENYIMVEKIIEETENYETGVYIRIFFHVASCFRSGFCRRNIHADQMLFKISPYHSRYRAKNILLFSYVRLSKRPCLSTNQDIIF